MKRNLHPLRAQRWFFSENNPFMGALPAIAAAVKANRKPVSQDNSFRRLEEACSGMITASLNLYRDLRDAASEAAFFQIFGSMIALGFSGDVKPPIQIDVKVEPHELTYVKQALSSLDQGGYPEALARIGALVGWYAGAIPLDRLEMADDFVRSDKVLSKLSADQILSLRSDAGVMVLLEPERTQDALPQLLNVDEDRERVVAMLQWGLSMEGITPDQRAMILAIMDRLNKPGTRSVKRKEKMYDDFSPHHLMKMKEECAVETIREISNVPFDKIEAGQSDEMSMTLTKTQVDMLALVSGDADAFYFEGGGGRARSEAQRVEAVGAGAILSALIGIKLPDPGFRILSQALAYKGDIRTGDTITATVTARQKQTEGAFVALNARYTNQHGDELVTGTVSVAAPTSHLFYNDITPPNLVLRRNDSFAGMFNACEGCAPVVCAVAHPCDTDSLMGAIAAARRNLIIPVLVGPEEKIRSVAAASGIDISPYQIISTPRSQAFVMDVPTYRKPFIITDAAVNIFPNLEDKIDIIKNAIDLAHVLNVANPKVALLSAVETVTSNIPSTLDAAALCKMADRGQNTGGIIDVPLAYDNAISAEAARTKGITSPVSGDLDIMVAPDLESANMIFKQLTYLAGAEGAGIVLGTRVPVILTSRADTVRTRLTSTAVMTLIAHARRTGKYETR